MDAFVCFLFFVGVVSLLLWVYSVVVWLCIHISVSFSRIFSEEVHETDGPVACWISLAGFLGLQRHLACNEKLELIELICNFNTLRAVARSYWVKCPVEPFTLLCGQSIWLNSWIFVLSSCILLVYKHDF